MDAYPHLNINVDDQSVYTPIEFQELPLHRPLYPMKTEMGPIGIPQWCPNYNFAVAVFGAKTFDINNPEYYSRSSAFLKSTFPNNGAYIVRIGTEANMPKASMLLSLELNSTTGVVNYVTSALTGDIDSAVATASSFPLMAFAAKNGGSSGNDLGVRIRPSSDLGLIEANGDISFQTFGYAKKDQFDTFQPIKTKYSPYTFNFATKVDSVNPSTQTSNNFEGVQDLYFDDNHQAPMDVHIYYENFNACITAGALAGVFNAVAEPSIPTIITDTPDAMNLLSGKAYNAGTGGFVDMWRNAALYNGASSNDLFGLLSTISLTGGSDGSLSVTGALDNNSTIEAAIVTWLQLTTEVITDVARYSYNMLIDTGYGDGVKDAQDALLGKREDLKVVKSCWQGEAIQNEASAYSVGKSALSSVILQPESELFGTGTFRATIFGQTGYLNDTSLWRGQMPLTLWYAVKLSEMHNVSYIKENPAGLPYSQVTMFKPTSINWVPANSASKREKWGSCINYCQYYDMEHIHFAGIKSVYKHDTSVLSSDSFANMLIYTKQLVRPIWAKYAGVESADLQSVYSQVLFDLDNAMSHMLAGRYDFKAEMYQTAEEALIGYVHHVALTITGGPSQRVWNLDIIAKRAGFEE